jgi:rubrerythrin
MGTDRMLAHALGIEDDAVIRNLETAFEEESKNSAACKAYAVNAEEEGYPGLASMFRATARADQIHASNHARVLRHMGGSTQFEVPLPRIEGAIENLRSALVDQKFEVEYLYPTFLTNAATLFDSTAHRSFHWALEADKSHIRLLNDVLARVSGTGQSDWAGVQHDFYVCSLCGFATEEANGENCPACNYLWEKFEKVS